MAWTLMHSSDGFPTETTTWKEVLSLLYSLTDLKQAVDQSDHAGVDLSLCLHPLDLPGFLALCCAGGLAQLEQLIALTHNGAH